MNLNTIPRLITQFGETVLNQSERLSIRQNCYTTLRNVREYCDTIIAKFEAEMASEKQKKPEKVFQGKVTAKNLMKTTD